MEKSNFQPGRRPAPSHGLPLLDAKWMGENEEIRRLSPQQNCQIWSVKGNREYGEIGPAVTFFKNSSCKNLFHHFTIFFKIIRRISFVDFDIKISSFSPCFDFRINFLKKWQIY